VSRPYNDLMVDLVDTLRQLGIDQTARVTMSLDDLERLRKNLTFEGVTAYQMKHGDPFTYMGVPFAAQGQQTVEHLRHLAHPLAECLGDKQRLDLMIKLIGEL